MGPALVEPEHRRVAGGPGPVDGELHPVADRRRPWSGTSGRCRRRSTGCSSTHRAGPVDHPDGAVGGDLEGLVVAAVLLGRLGHEADVGHRAHRRRVEGAVGPAVVDDHLVDAGVAAVGDDGEGVGLLAVRAPHVARGADHRRHRGVDDDVARHVQVGDAPVRVDHGQRAGRRPARRRTRPGSPRRPAARPGPLKMAPSPSLGLRPAAASVGAVRGRRSSGKKARTTWPKMIGSETFIIVAFRWTENRTPSALARAIWAARNSSQRGHPHDRGVDDLAGRAPARTRAARSSRRRRRPARCAACRPRRSPPTARWSGSRRPSMWVTRWSSSRATRRPSGAGGSGRSS